MRPDAERCAFWADAGRQEPQKRKERERVRKERTGFQGRWPGCVSLCPQMDTPVLTSSRPLSPLSLSFGLAVLATEYAQVLKMLGNGRLEAQCFDGTKRLGHIRGKLRKKVRCSLTLALTLATDCPFIVLCRCGSTTVTSSCSPCETSKTTRPM